jgi:hypothetical protein
MTSLKKQFITLLAIVSFAWHSGCTFKESYTPTFNSKGQAIVDSINDKYHFEAINVSVKNVLGSDRANDTLLVRFVNGTNLPDNDSSKVELAWHLGKRIIKGLKSTKQYDGYIIGFDTRKVNGDTTSHIYFDCNFTTPQMKKRG